VVLEFDGDAYQEWVKKTEKRINVARQKMAEEKKPNE